jgi:hypothetical protein
MILTPRRRGSRPRRERIAAHSGRNDPAQLGLVVDRRPAILKEAQKRVAADREKGALEPDSERLQLARLPHFLLRKASLLSHVVSEEQRKWPIQAWCRPARSAERLVCAAQMSKSSVAFSYRGAMKLHFAGFQNSGFMQRQTVVPIVFSEEDAEQHSVTGSLHESHPLHRIEVLHPADGPIIQ